METKHSEKITDISKIKDPYQYFQIVRFANTCPGAQLADININNCIFFRNDSPTKNLDKLKFKNNSS